MSVNEQTLKVTQYTVLGKLPELLKFNDGTPVKTPADWEKRRAEIYRSAIELQYGTIPPAPEFLEVETLFIDDKNGSGTYKIHTGTLAHPVSFHAKILLPRHAANCPVIIDGDISFDYFLNADFISAAIDKGIGWMLFDRTELAHDLPTKSGRPEGALPDTYPDLDFGALAAWAWGYSRCVDALEKLALSGVDLDWVIFSGHSRGAKTAMLAGALDTRAVIVNPNETCAGSCSCYRVHMKGIDPNGVERPSETLADLIRNYGYWMGPGMANYVTCEEKLPFDTHFLKAMIAPRTLFVSEAAGDLWANPVGSYQTTRAAEKVFEFLGAEDRLFWYYREGTHAHTLQDVRMLVEVICNRKNGTPVCDDFFKAPFPPVDPID